MLAKAFFDTNVLIYAVVENDARNARAEELLASGGVVSVQVLNEFVAVARRKMSMPWKDVTEALDAFRVLCPFPLPITAELHEAALEVAQKHGFNIYDALIVAAALEGGCTTFYSEDFHDGHTIHGRVTDGRVREGKITIRNPFIRLSP
jgi:predicted nucleic acid-binding protein